MVSQLVACSAKLSNWRRRIRQLGLLHQQHVGPRPLQPPGDLFQAGFWGVDVPGSDVQVLLNSGISLTADVEVSELGAILWLCPKPAGEDVVE
jgi:hypothetical protein